MVVKKGRIVGYASQFFLDFLLRTVLPRRSQSVI